MGQPETSRRSAMFFASDASNAAATAAHEMSDFGLSPDQIWALAQRIETVIGEFFQREAWNAE